MCFNRFQNPPLCVLLLALRNLSGYPKQRNTGMGTLCGLQYRKADRILALCQMRLGSDIRHDTEIETRSVVVWEVCADLICFGLRADDSPD